MLLCNAEVWARHNVGSNNKNDTATSITSGC